MAHSANYLYLVAQILTFLSRRTNFDREEFQLALGTGKNHTNILLNTLADIGYVEKVVHSTGPAGGSIWRSAITVKYRDAHRQTEVHDHVVR